MITTIIFDMNGVIVDDEAIQEQAFQAVCKELGISLSHDMYLELCIGRTDASGFEAIITKFSLKDADAPALAVKKSQKYLAVLPSAIRAYPGVLDLIQNLKKRPYHLALASSSGREEVMAVLTAFDLNKEFEAIVTGDDVVKSKPNPEPYLLTAQKLAAHPSQCLVIEDSASGVRSAKQAGMYCIAITTTHERIDLADADICIGSFGELTKEMITRF